MEDMKSQDFVQKFTVMMQELEQQQEVLRKEAEQRHQEALEEIKALLTGISFRNIKIANNMTQAKSTKAREDPLEDLKNLKQEFTLQDYWNSFNQMYSKARIQEEKVLNFLLSELVDELQLAVKMFKPRTLSEAYSLARLQEVTVATIKNNVNPDTKPIIFITPSFPPSTPSNLQSNFPKLSGSGDKFDLLPIPIIQLPKLPGVPPRNPKLEHHENFKGEKSINGSSLPKSVKVYEGKAYALVTTKIEQHKKRVGGKKQYMNYGNYGEFDLGAHEKYRNYENCVEFDLSDHDYITLKEDEFERWKRQRKKFYGRVDLLYKKIYKSYSGSYWFIQESQDACTQALIMLQICSSFIEEFFFPS
ncbi:hypothetical protein GH714_026623 [Hevea brasiliensis]|uniref:Uncharacterized protein n=1 Tax=Hevea brasiliensis TaxID=3981 RepID=A0A6A6MDD7_HEVBR|nr:hypothetical protein GH714_026623 [Hevea brasiliensis]